MLMRAVYQAAIALAVPFALLRLLWRGRSQPGYRAHWLERFGLDGPPSTPGAIWIHAVSVGEMRAAEPLVKTLRARHPQIPLLLTCMTPTGRDTAEQLFGEGAVVRYLPYDLVPALRRFLRQYRPRMGILMETELWPALMSVCGEMSVPLFVVNGRLSARSAKRYGYARRLMRDAFRGVSAVAAQSADDAGRFRELGAQNVHVCGNLKFDRAPQQADLVLGEQFRRRLGGRPMVLLASSREGEEAMVLRAWQQSSVGDVILGIVPRHPQRFDAVAALIAQAGMTCQRRRDGASVAPDTQVWLGDSMGEMFAYYAACDVALIGGSFLELGGQNLLEACALGKPVIFGPHMFNFSEAARLAAQAGAALQVDAVAAAVQASLHLAQDSARGAVMGNAGRDLMSAHQGATRRVLDLLKL